MKKDMLKGAVIGGCAAFILANSATVFAQGIDVVLNSLRINVNGVDRAQWGDSYTLANGATVPNSILYEGTTYLPIRKISEMTGLQILYNGDSKTVSVLSGGNQASSADTSVSITKPDKNGNLWNYKVFSDIPYLLHVSDEKRGFERVYPLQGFPFTTDDALYFVSVMPEKGHEYEAGAYPVVRKISFNSDSSNQDGIVVAKITIGGESPRILRQEGQYAYFVSPQLNNSAFEGDVGIINIVTGKSAVYKVPVNYNLDDVESTFDCEANGNFTFTSGGTKYIIKTTQGDQPTISPVALWTIQDSIPPITPTTPNTVSVLSSGSEIVKADDSGNVWNYSIVTHSSIDASGNSTFFGYYLDVNRQPDDGNPWEFYLGKNPLNQAIFTDEGVYFVGWVGDGSNAVFKIPFSNPESQDQEINKVLITKIDVFDKLPSFIKVLGQQREYIYLSTWQGDGAGANYSVEIVNMITGKTAVCKLPGQDGVTVANTLKYDNGSFTYTQNGKSYIITTTRGDQPAISAPIVQ